MYYSTKLPNRFHREIYFLLPFKKTPQCIHNNFAFISVLFFYQHRNLKPTPKTHPLSVFGSWFIWGPQKPCPISKHTITHIYFWTALFAHLYRDVHISAEARALITRGICASAGHNLFCVLPARLCVFGDLVGKFHQLKDHIHNEVLLLMVCVCGIWYIYICIQRANGKGMLAFFYADLK